jgi:hypothetical protein
VLHGAGAADRAVADESDGLVVPLLPYLALTSVFTVIRLLPMSDTDKDIEILTLRHQLAILQRQPANRTSPG